MDIGREAAFHCSCIRFGQHPLTVGALVVRKFCWNTKRAPSLTLRALLVPQHLAGTNRAPNVSEGAAFCPNVSEGAAFCPNVSEGAFPRGWRAEPKPTEPGA